MTNSYKGNPVFLDVFTSAIDLRSHLGLPEGAPLKLLSIEWAYPSTVNHTALITDKAGGRAIFKEICFVAKQPIEKPFNGEYVDNLYIAANGVQSGAIFILLG